MSILSDQHVVKKYQSAPSEIRALDDLTLDIEPREFVAIMGPTGIPWIVVGAQFLLIPVMVALLAWVGSALSRRYRPERLVRYE